MIFFASYFEPQNHHGEIISISRSNPREFSKIRRIELFVPSKSLLYDYKKGLSNESYIERYREEIRGNWGKIKLWLLAIEPTSDKTLRCWERTDEFCHRNLVAKIVEKYRPDCFGGCDVKTF